MPELTLFAAAAPTARRTDRRAVPTRIPGRLITRGAAAIAGLAALAGSVALLGPWALTFRLLPDVAMLIGFSRELTAHGRLAPRTVPYYNAVHALPCPVLLLVIAIAFVPALLGPALLWLSHVLIDRALGYGLRTADGWQRG